MAEARASDYSLAIVSAEMKSVLEAALGVAAVVEKVRTLYLWEDVRIHLDQVAGLGDFIEFEAVLSDKHNDEDGHRKLGHLRQAFEIEPGDVLSRSYLDLVLDNATSTPVPGSA